MAALATSATLPTNKLLPKMAKQLLNQGDCASGVKIPECDDGARPASCSVYRHDSSETRHRSCDICMCCSPCCLRVPVILSANGVLVTAACALGLANDFYPEDEHAIEHGDPIYGPDNPNNTNVITDTRVVTTFLLITYVLTVFTTAAALVMRFAFLYNVRLPVLLLMIADLVAATMLSVCYFVGCGLCVPLVDQWTEWANYDPDNDAGGWIAIVLLCCATMCGLTGVLLVLCIPAILVHMFAQREKLCNRPSAHVQAETEKVSTMHAELGTPVA